MITEEKRQALIEQLNKWISEPQPGHSNDVRIAFEIALASLEAEPAGNFAYHEDEDGDPTDFIVESDGFSKDSFKLYPAPTVPALKMPDKREYYPLKTGSEPWKISHNLEACGFNECLAEVKRINGVAE